ncbi:MAG: vWA domain-containing protein [Bacilli bacterium]|jgi:uncharacterized protein YegL
MTKKQDAEGSKPVTHVAIVLDRSGSMASCRAETISGFNAQVQKITGKTKADGTADSTLITLVLFNHEVEFVHFASPVDNLKEIAAEQYVPNGTTAMLDAVGLTLKRFEKKVKDSDDTRYLVIIISDGEENESKEFTYERIAEMIQKRQQTGRWTFSYMGANQDLSDLSKRLSIPKSNMATYTSSPSGTMIGFSSLSKSTMGFLDKQSKGTATSEKFFRNEDEIQSVDDADDSSGKKGGGPLLH